MSPDARPRAPKLRTACRRSAPLLAAALLCGAGCAGVGRLQPVPATVSPMKTHAAGENPRPGGNLTGWSPLFGDTLIGFIPGTADSSRRYLGRLRSGYTADTVNFILFGDNRPGYRMTRMTNEAKILKEGLSLNPLKFLRAVAFFPVALWRALVPDLGLLRDIPDYLRNMPTYGRERQVISAMLEKIDSLNARGQTVSVAVNSGDVIEDGRRPKHWERFLRLTRPLSSRVPYFPVPGNHEQTWSPEGVANWWAATGLPVGGERLYFCFDTADGWVRFIGLDTNPIVDPGRHWTREAQIKYSKEQFDWAVARIKEHRGPVVVNMHHPPLSVGYHRDEWQRDSVLIKRRADMFRALHEAGIAAIVSAHEHGYQRVLLTWPDAVVVAIVAGGGGAPLHELPPPPMSAAMFDDYKIAGGIVKPENTHVAMNFNYVLARFWFGGGEFIAYAVDNKSRSTEIDHVEIDLKRYGIPKIDQHKMVIAPEPSPRSDKEAEVSTKTDSVSASRRLLASPPPSKAKARKKTQ